MDNLKVLAPPPQIIAFIIFSNRFCISGFTLKNDSNFWQNINYKLYQFISSTRIF